MKKSVKVCLTVFIILFVIGGILCVAGASLGFGFPQFWDMAENGAFSWGPQEGDGIGLVDLEETEWLTEDAHWSPEEIRDIEVNYNFGTLIIEPSEDEEIHISAEYRSSWDSYERTIRWKREKDTLKIEDKMDQKILKLFNTNDGDATLRIQLPIGISFDEISLEAGAALVLLDTTLEAKEIEITVGAGEVCQEDEEIMAAKAKEIQLEIGAGTMSLTGVEAKELDLDCGAGEMNIQAVAADFMDVDCGVGQLTMAVLGNEEDYNYEIDCGIGEIAIGNASYGGLGNSKKIRNGSDKSMDIDCGIGQVSILFEN